MTCPRSRLLSTGGGRDASNTSFSKAPRISKRPGGNSSLLHGSGDGFDARALRKANHTRVGTTKGGTDGLRTLIKTQVSKKKRRLKLGGLDLDLTYITPKIIAMGFPSEGIEAQYRNSMKDVQKFFAQRHPGNYHLYNLCIERDYNHDKFEGRVKHMGFHDHNPCFFNSIEPTVAHMRKWIDNDEKHVCAVHCKAGKGRTGFMIACFLVYSNSWFNDRSALRFFAVKRTKDQKGVTIPSQKRYVRYFYRYCRAKQAAEARLLARISGGEDGSSDSKEVEEIPEEQPLLLLHINVLAIPKVITAAHSKSKKRSVDVTFKIITDSNGEEETYYSQSGAHDPVPCEYRPEEDYLRFTCGKRGITTLNGDARFIFYYNKKKMFQFWLNTRFLAPTGRTDDKSLEYSFSLEKHEIDTARKDIKHKLYAANFKVDLTMMGNG